MKKKILILVALLGVTYLGFLGCSNNAGKPDGEESMALDSFQCPMDCEMGKFYHQNGSCPVCEMDMVKIDR
jgi:hypothetical protein